jgi:hypothetical protein
MAVAAGAVMKPSDFFLTRRHFLGFLVPGLLWLATPIWLCAIDLLGWFKEAKARELGLVVVAGYVVGYVVQSATFAILWWWRRTRAEGSHSTGTASVQTPMSRLKADIQKAVQSDARLVKLNACDLAQFCKWHAAKDSYFQSQFSEFEDEINFTIGLSVPMMLLGIVGLVLTLGSWVGEHRLCYGGASVATLLMGAYMLWRFSYLWRAEEEAWYKAFLVTWPRGSAQSSPNADIQDDCA